MKFLATKSWSIHYPDPIRGAAGDQLQLGRRDEGYPGWIWATAADGRAGWVPESWLKIEGEDGILQCDYTAAELPLAVGDTITGEVELNGWLWATNAAGEWGWVPLDCLMATDSLL